MANFIRAVMLFFTGVTLPMSFVQITSFGPFGVTPNKISAAGLLVVAILMGVAERQKMPRNPKGWWVAAFSASMVIGTTIAIARGGRWDQILVVITILAAVVVFYFLIVYVVRDMKSLGILFAGLILGVGITSLSVIMQWGVVKAGRTGGFAGDPNNFGFIAAATLPIALYYFTTTRSLLLKVSLAGMAVLTLAGIAASLSRTPVVELAFMGALWMVRFRRFDVLRLAVPLVGVVIFFVFLTSPEWVERMSTLTSAEAAQDDGSIMKRVKQNALAVEAVVTNPIIGVGYQQFGHWAGGRINKGTAIHNSYLHVAAELGLLGLFSYIGLIAASYIELGRAWRLCRSLRSRADPLIEKLYLMSVLVQISLVGTIIGNLFLSSLRYRVSWMLYACATVLLLMVRERARALTIDERAQTQDAGYFSAAHHMHPRTNQPARV